MSSHPRWLVKFDGQAYTDEEMYERAFGKLLRSAVVVEEGNEGFVGPDDAASSCRKKSSKVKANIGEVSSEGEKSDSGPVSKAGAYTKSKNDKKSVQFSSEADDDDGAGGGDGTDDGGSSPLEDCEKLSGTRSGSNGRKSKSSAREQRSRRRHAKIDEESLIMFPGMELLDGGKRKIAPNVGPTSKKHRLDPSMDGAVVKVQLLTGTLHLYRGSQRRAEFVRRV
jgi:hypothetical protein